MAQRDVTIEAGGKSHALRFSCAAAEILDPEGEKSISEVVQGFRRLSFLRRAVFAGLEGHRQHHNPSAPPFTEKDAVNLIDEVGPLKAADAVTTAYMGWNGIEPKPEVAEGPKA